jgi:hypothetical protein
LPKGRNGRKKYINTPHDAHRADAFARRKVKIKSLSMSKAGPPSSAAPRRANPVAYPHAGRLLCHKNKCERRLGFG